VGQISNVSYGSKHRPMVANNRHKLKEKYEREYRNMMEEWKLWLDNVTCVTESLSL